MSPSPRIAQAYKASAASSGAKQLRQRQRMRRRYLRHVDPRTIRRVTEEELYDLSERRATRILMSGIWSRDDLGHVWTRPFTGRA